MTDTEHHGVMAMVKIDGGKVKQLREQKGLTQLYVATVVQVTTDTISRWENKRYPTIKKENCIRLAEALEVELNEILDTEPEIQTKEVEQGLTEQKPAKAVTLLHRNWRTLSIAISLLVLITLFISIYLYTDATVQITAQRILPKKCTFGQPFPITIEVVGTTSEPLTVILKEHLPQGMSVQGSEPALPSGSSKGNTLKWLNKIEGKMLFTYIALLTEPLPHDPVFSGSIAASNSADTPLPTTGNTTTVPSHYHWADGNGDNIISDKEILAVYDQHGDLESLGLDVDLIEEIWLGSGYTWSEEKQTYEILP